MDCVFNYLIVIKLRQSELNFTFCASCEIPCLCVPNGGFSTFISQFLSKNSPKIIAEVVPLSGSVLIGLSFSFHGLTLTHPVRNGAAFFQIVDFSWFPNVMQGVNIPFRAQ